MVEISEERTLLHAAGRAFRSALVVACFVELAFMVGEAGGGQQLSARSRPLPAVTVAAPTTPQAGGLIPLPPPPPERQRMGQYPLYIFPERAERLGERPTRNPDVWPVPVRRVEPECNDVAVKARVHGVVLLEVVVSSDGAIIGGWIRKPLPFGLDQKAVEAVRQWRFKPGTIDGRPVATIMKLTLNFRCDQPR